MIQYSSSSHYEPQEAEYGYVSKNDKALIAVYDILDGRQLCRQRLFNNWFQTFGYDTLEMPEASCRIGDTPTLASILFRKDCINRLDIEKEFVLLAEINFYN